MRRRLSIGSGRDITDVSAKRKSRRTMSADFRGMAPMPKVKRKRRSNSLLPDLAEVIALVNAEEQLHNSDQDDMSSRYSDESVPSQTGSDTASSYSVSDSDDTGAYSDAEDGNIVSVLKHQYKEFKHDETETATAFNKIPSGDKRKAKLTKAEKLRNRHGNISPGADSLIRLTSNNGQDYINANLCKLDTSYIATQGPLPHTVEDFWALTIQEDVKVIVMLCNCVEEGGSKKCQKYWPEKMGAAGRYKLRCLSTDELYGGNVIVRRFSVTSKHSEPHQVSQVHFTVWPDHGVPENLQMQQVLDATDEQHKLFPDSKLMVHCSAGVGRTGTFIVIHTLLTKMRKQIKLSIVKRTKSGETKSIFPSRADIFNTTVRLRKMRPFMVSQREQYSFVHDYLEWELDAYMEGIAGTLA